MEDYQIKGYNAISDFEIKQTKPKPLEEVSKPCLKVVWFFFSEAQGEI